MVLRKTLRRRCGHARILLALVFAGLLPPSATGQQTKLEVLHIGSSGTFTGASKGNKEKEALETLKAFIKDETGLDNDIQRQPDWRELADRMAKGQLQLGVFQGYEFAWALDGRPGLKPLALAVNVYRYPTVYIVVKKDNPAKDFAGIQGQSLSVPATGEGILNLFVERQSQAQGKKLDAFFAKVTAPENVEEALDDVVDGVVQATVIDRAALEAFKRRKPARFSQLRPVVQSQPFPPPVVAYYDKQLDEATLQRFQQGLLNASKKERGQTMLTLFHLTNFEPVPPDFGEVLAKTRKAYPPAPPTK